MSDKYKIIAAIDIGSNKISMTIAEIFSDGRVNFIEDVKKSSSIGKDTFNDGRISVKTIYEICDILKKFSTLMTDYGVESHVAIATSGLREADNREYVIEQIKIKSGINVEIINNAQERFFSYLALKNHLDWGKETYSKPALVVNTSSGGVEVSVQKNGKIVFTEYLKLGSLRLRETLAGLENLSIDYPKILEEFIESKLYLIKNIIKSMKIRSFMGIGGEMNNILNILQDDIKTNDEKIQYININNLLELYNKLKSMSINQMMDTYDISRSEAEILLPSVILYCSFIKMTKAEEILALAASHRFGIIFDLAEKAVKNEDYINENIINAVWKIAKKYGTEKKHSMYIAKIALSIFNQTLELSKLSKKDALYLHIASILHDVGNYAGFTSHELQTYNIIKMQSMLGISDEELDIIANIAYYHTSKIPSRQHENYMKLSYENRIRVSKLAAFLKFAESLDCSHTQKIEKLTVRCEKDFVVISVKASKDMLLEKWSVEENFNYFEEVIGVRPILKIVK